MSCLLRFLTMLQCLACSKQEFHYFTVQACQSLGIVSFVHGEVGEVHSNIRISESACSSK